MIIAQAPSRVFGRQILRRQTLGRQTFGWRAVRLELPVAVVLSAASTLVALTGCASSADSTADSALSLEGNTPSAAVSDDEAPLDRDASPRSGAHRSESRRSERKRRGLSPNDWPSFRGPGSSGVAAGASLPSIWNGGDGTGVEWKVSVPGRGLSSPIVVGDRVFLTASDGLREEELHVVCLRVDDGSEVWTRSFWASGPTFCHPKTAVAAPTPVCDGERIFAFFSSNDVACLDLEGNLQWFRGVTSDYPNASNSVGMSSSPVVADGTLVLQVENDTDSFALGLDAETGTNAWKIERPRKVNWTSPVVLGDAVLLQSMNGVSAVEPSTGEERWTLETKCAVIPSLTVAGDTLLVPGGGMTGWKLRSGVAPEEAWKSSRLNLATASAVVHSGRIYAVTKSVLKCADLETGDSHWDLRLTGPFSSSPVIAGDHLYVFNERGVGHVVRLGSDTGELVSENDLGETVLATPAIAHDSLFVRSDGHLWRLRSD